MDSKALTKVQSAVLVAVIIVAAVGGAIAYVLWKPSETANTIKIGVLADLDMSGGKGTWQAAQLAAEQLNAEGGILGKKVELIGEDSDVESISPDIMKVTTAMLKLTTYHKVDFIIAQASGEAGFVCQDLAADHKKIILMHANTEDQYTERVLENYERYKYFFRGCSFNATAVFQGITDSMLLMRNLTGFNKIGYLGHDIPMVTGIMEGLDHVLPGVYGFDLVYKGKFPMGTVDFASYFAKAEAAETEILIPLILALEGVSFAKEYYDRQSPTFVAGGVLAGGNIPESWGLTEGKCEHMIVAEFPTTTGYPLTSETVPFREAYISKWGESPSWTAAYSYDSLRFILADAIRRAGTTETEAVIMALETTSIETANAQNFVFTSSHDVMMGENPNDPQADYQLVMLFQWQDGEMVPVYPKKIMEKEGATLTFPDWPGPWNK